MKPTERDRALLEYVYRFRVLRSRDHILPLFGDKETILRRAQKLSQAGYLYKFERENTYTQYIYGLGNQGAKELKSWKSHLRIARNNWSHHNQRLKRISIEHALLVADIAIGIEVACMDNPQVRYIPPEEIFERAPSPTRKRWYEMKRTAADDPFRLSAPIRWKGSLKTATIYADWMFGLELLDRKPSPKVYFFVEADRGTMPVTSGKIEKPSILKKLLVYQAAAMVYKGIEKPNVLEETFGIRGVRTLFVIAPDQSRGSSGNERIKNCLKANRDISEGKGSSLFLFTSRDIYRSQNPLAEQIMTGLETKTTLIA